jgi:hypothetical protein
MSNFTKDLADAPLGQPGFGGGKLALAVPITSARILPTRD